VFTALTVKAEKPPLAEGINGGWHARVDALIARARGHHEGLKSDER
jgi:hypothetical protein